VSSANGVAVDFCGCGSGAAVCFFLAEFSCCYAAAADEWAVAFHFRGSIVGAGFLLAPLSKHPEDYPD
jgi:hypothetical protein